MPLRFELSYALQRLNRITLMTPSTTASPEMIVNQTDFHALDKQDPLAHLREEFELDQDLIYRVDEGASSAPRLDITLEQDDALDGTDVDAPAAETSAGIRLEGDSLPGDEDGAEIRPVTLLLDDMQDTPAAYPTGPRALDYHGLATDTDVQVRIVPRSVDLIAVQCVELVRL